MPATRSTEFAEQIRRDTNVGVMSRAQLVTGAA